MRAILIASSILAVFALAPASADHCNGTVVELGGVAYVDVRGVNNDIWIYLESNGVVGLQTGGNQAVLGYEDGCSHDNPDMLLY